MYKIPEKLRRELSSDPYYRKCCLTGESRGKIDWHHAMMYGGKQINKRWNILPILSRKHLPSGDTDSVHNCKETREKAELIALLRATKEELNKYSKANFAQRLKYLSEKYGKETIAI